MGIAPSPSATARAAIVASPGWHRRLRKRRSSARARVRAARLRGRLPRIQDIWLLQAHHTAPRYREARLFTRRLMGKTAPWKAGQNGQGQQSWSYWRGSWGSPSQGQGQANKQLQMPRYDQVQLQDDASWAQPAPNALGTAGPPASADSGDLMRAIQKALTATRKVDQKMRKIGQDRDQKERQWRQFAAEMKATYEKEHRKYRADLQRLDQDLEMVLRQGQEAAETVKALASRGVHAVVEDAIPMEDSGWDSLIAGTENETEQGLEDGFLREALRAAEATRALALQPTQQKRVLGPASGRQVPVSLPQQLGQVAVSDPYVTSPSHVSMPASVGVLIPPSGLTGPALAPFRQPQHLPMALAKSPAVRGPTGELAGAGDPWLADYLLQSLQLPSLTERLAPL